LTVYLSEKIIDKSKLRLKGYIISKKYQVELLEAASED